MKRVCAFLLCFCSLFLFSSCKNFFVDKEKKMCSQTIKDLCDGMDKKDADAIYNLFSPKVKKQDKDLKQQINKMLTEYKGPMDELGWDELVSGEAEYDEGKHLKESSVDFLVRCGNTYYWFVLNLIYENTFDEKEIGVTQMDFYTAEDYYAFINDDNAGSVDSTGLEVHCDNSSVSDIRCISGEPYKYDSSTKPIDLGKVKEFFKTSRSFKDFKKKFGKPNAKDIYKYYQLTRNKGKTCYLEISTDKDDIYNATIVDDFKYIETVFEKEENK